MTPRRLNPTVAALYLILTGVVSFVLVDLTMLVCMVVLQLVLGTYFRSSRQDLLRPFRKLWVFTLLVIGSYTLMGAGPEDVTISLAPWPWPISLTGLEFGAAMVLRVFTVVLASGWIRRVGKAEEFVVGLRSLGMPHNLAQLLDHTLRLLDSAPDMPGNRRQGGGRGTGGGHGRNRKGGRPIRDFFSADGNPLVGRLSKFLGQASQSADGLSRDTVVLSGILLMMLSLKALKIMPGLPFAPGHKGVVLIPLYLLATHMTKGRFGGTLLGTAFGVLSFLFGDGRYGVFEILKHITPGLLSDVFAPVVARSKSTIAFGLVGLLMAAGRWATIAAVVVLVGAPPAVIAALVPAGLVHLVFGALSGAVAKVLLSATAQFDGEVDTKSESRQQVAQPPVAEEVLSRPRDERDLPGGNGGGNGAGNGGGGRGRGNGSGGGGGRGRGNGSGAGRGRTHSNI